MIRYYGIYSAKKHFFKELITTVYKYTEILEMKKVNLHRNRLIHDFNVDPIRCEGCGSIMKKVYDFWKGKVGKTYEISYEEKQYMHSNQEHFTRYCPTRY